MSLAKDYSAPAFNSTTIEDSSLLSIALAGRSTLVLATVLMGCHHDN
jgi:hypothetical protein